jgi:hypothetical protein
MIERAACGVIREPALTACGKTLIPARRTTPHHGCGKAEAKRRVAPDAIEPLAAETPEQR